VAGLSPGTRHLLEIVHLLEFIATFENEAEALAAHPKGHWEQRA
jgi:hypothetical protein